MKAKDLAALAALGVAGFAAYDKFGRKKDEPKKKMGEGLEMSNQGAYERATRSQSDAGDVEMGTKGAYLPETAELRTKGAYLDDTPEFRTKGAYLDERTAPVAVAKPVRKAEVEPRSLDSTGGPARYRRDDDSEAPAAPASKQFTLPGTQSAMGDFSRAMLPEQRIAAIDAKSGASSPSAKKTEALAALSKAEQAKDVAKKRAAGTFREIPQNVKPAVVKPTAAAPSAPVSAAEAARQRRIDESNYDSDLMKGRRQAVVDTVQGIPSRVADIFKPPEKEFQNKTYFNPMTGKVVKYNKGGAVKKMASGGMTSSKMSSKPSTASSRGDGIAQRGKTRGKMC